MLTIAHRILKLESMIKTSIVVNHAFFTSITFGKMNFFAYISQFLQFYRNAAFIRSNLQKDCHQNNLPFVCLQFYRHNCLKF